MSVSLTTVTLECQPVHIRLLKVVQACECSLWVYCVMCACHMIGVLWVGAEWEYMLSATWLPPKIANGLKFTLHCFLTVNQCFTVQFHWTIVCRMDTSSTQQPATPATSTQQQGHCQEEEERPREVSLIRTDSCVFLAYHILATHSLENQTSSNCFIIIILMDWSCHHSYPVQNCSAFAWIQKSVLSGRSQQRESTKKEQTSPLS